MATATYLKALNRTLSEGWLSAYEALPTAVEDRLALVHPWHFSELNLPRHQSPALLQSIIQGDRQFRAETFGTRCCADLLWGYKCDMDATLQLDHLFPYSLGGPTVFGNMITLCKYHNLVKSADVHCYPWEACERWANPWLNIQIEKIKNSVFDVYGGV